MSLLTLPQGFNSCVPSPVAFRMDGQTIEGDCIAFSDTGKLWIAYEWQRHQRWCEIAAQDCWVVPDAWGLGK